MSKKPHRLLAAVAAGAVLCALLYRSFRKGQAPDLKLLFYKTHRWFQLRDAVESQEIKRRFSTPPLYRAAVDSAFHDLAAAEKLAVGAIRSAREYGTYEGRSILEFVYRAHGRFRDALSEIQAMANDPGPACECEVK